MDKIFKSSYHYPRKNSRCILESKWHYRVLEIAPFYQKGHLVSILFKNLNLMVSRNPSIEEYISCTPMISKTSYVNDVGNESCKQASFNFLRSTQILTSPEVFLYCNTIGLIHCDSSIGSITPAPLAFSPVQL